MNLLEKCSYENVESKIQLYYGSNELEHYKKLYDELKVKKISTLLDKDFYIYINAYQEIEDDEYIKVDNFDENDTSLYFDVSGYEYNDDTTYSIAASHYANFLQYKIDEKTLKQFTPEAILAHCFWEITCYGFKDNA